VYFGMGGVVLCMSRDVEIVQDAAGVCDMGGKDNGGVGRKKGYIYSSSGDCLVHCSPREFCWSTNTKRPSLHCAAPPSTSWTTSLETRFCTPSEDSLQHRPLLLHLIPY
jgi:hypothetical protein